MGYQEIWPIRLVVRTPGFHPGNRSSILLWAKKKNVNKLKLWQIINRQLKESVPTKRSVR